MGKKIPFDEALKMGIKPSDSIYNDGNPYGYLINVNHPQIRPLYERYKHKYGIIIPSDKERHIFEQHIIAALERKRHEYSDPERSHDS